MGLKINTKTIGHGKPILILHGWGSSSKSWEKVQSYLAEKGYKVIVPDMPGFGESDPPPAPWNAEAYLNWLLDFTKSYKLKAPFYLVGHSFGGGLAMKLAIEYPELIKKLILIGAARVATKQHRKDLHKPFLYIIAKIGRIFSFLPFFETIRKGFYKLIVRENDYARTKGVMRETIKLILQEDITSQIHKIKSPTLIVWGANDKSTPIENGYLINKKIKGSVFEALNGCGHSLNLECPEKLAEIIYNFLK